MLLVGTVGLRTDFKKRLAPRHVRVAIERPIARWRIVRLPYAILAPSLDARQLEANSLDVGFFGVSPSTCSLLDLKDETPKPALAKPGGASEPVIARMERHQHRPAIEHHSHVARGSPYATSAT